MQQPVYHLLIYPVGVKQEAIGALDRRAFTRVVRNILKDEPEGLNGIALRKHLHSHPEHMMEVPMKYLHVWLAELSRADAIVIDHPNSRYLHPRHADEEAAVYRPRITVPPSVAGEDGGG